MKQALAVPVSAMTPVKPGVIQRKCGCGDKCACQEKEKLAGVVQRQAAPAARSAGTLAPGTAARIQAAAQGGGRALPAPTRTLMESRLGRRDFSNVRVHADSTADGLSRQMGAEAFTVGNNIFFAAGRYDPQSATGQKLLAHELTHVVQQGGGAAAAQPKLELGGPDTPAEREADHVAETFASGLAAGPILRSAAGAVQRFPNPLPAPQSTPPSGGTGHRVVLPPTVKLMVYGAKALNSADLNAITQLYKRAAATGALRTTHAGRSTNTEQLWAMWAASRGPAGDAIRRGPLRTQCSPDHIVELQVGGADNANNLRLLDRTRNSRAGNRLYTEQVRPLSTHYIVPGGYDDQSSFLQFADAEAVESGEAAADPCLQADPMLLPGGAIRAGAGEQSLNVQVGGNPVSIGYDGTTGDVGTHSRLAVSGAESIRVRDNAAKVDADISPHVRRLPFRRGSATAFVLKVDGTPPRLAFDTAPPNVTLAFPFLSEASLVPALEHGQWIATGDFNPSLPLLRFAQVHVEIRNEQLSATASIPADRIRQALPIPGLTIDPVNLTLSAANGQFSASGGFGFSYGTFARGSVTATLSNTAGFSANGNIDLTIPGIDQARGEAWIRNGRFGGRINIGANKLRFPGVQTANLVIGIADGVLTGTGTVGLSIPGLRNPTLTFTANSQGQYGIAGEATGSIPGLRNPRLRISYANGALGGTGTAGFVIPGFEGGNITLLYQNGQFSGNASLDYRRGRLSGRITANLSPAHRLSGRGELGYEIAPGLVALVGLEIRENGTAAVSGELRLPDPIILFPERAYDRRLFGVSIDIPIFGISFGSRSVGVIANLSVSLNARAGIGPGQIRRPRIIAAFDPSREAGAASFQASGELYVPASAEVVAVLSAGIGVSLLIVRAIGGVQATGSVGLLGALSVPIDLRYVGGKFTVNGAAELFAQPRLRLRLDAFVRVDADLLLTTIELYRKEWRLAAFEWGGDFRIGLRFPVRYSFGEPFNLSLDQVQLIAPQIDARRLIRDLLPR